MDRGRSRSMLPQPSTVWDSQKPEAEEVPRAAEDTGRGSHKVQLSWSPARPDHTSRWSTPPGLRCLLHQLQKTITARNKAPVWGTGQQTGTEDTHVTACAEHSAS